MLNGADGLGEIAAGLVAPSLNIFESVKRNLNYVDAQEGEDDPVEAPPDAIGSPPPGNGVGDTGSLAPPR